MPRPIPRPGSLRAAVIACALAAWGGQARADIELCDESKRLVFSTAVGYFSSDAQQWTTRGWYRTTPGTCITALTGALTQNVVYLYSSYGVPMRSTDDLITGVLALAISMDSLGEIAGDYAMCTQRDRFTIVGETRCVSRGFERRGFAEIRTGGARHVLIELLDDGRVSVSPRP